MILIYGLLIYFFKGQVITHFDQRMPSRVEIIRHNLGIFFKWQILFIFSLIYWIFETLILSWSIKTGIDTYGVLETINRLWKHGIIEIPNIFLYQLISLRLFYFWYKERTFSIIKEYISVNKKIYLLSIILIVIAGVIEGKTW